MAWDFVMVNGSGFCFLYIRYFNSELWIPALRGARFFCKRTTSASSGEGKTISMHLLVNLVFIMRVGEAFSIVSKRPRFRELWCYWFYAKNKFNYMF
jgi:hypothetical protein